MGKPDALSRQADHRSRQGDNDNLMLLAPELFQIHALAGIRLESDERCNVAHNPDLRTANYMPEFPPICCLPSPFLSVTTATFTVIATIYVVSTVFTVFTATAAISVSSTSVSNRSPHSVSSVRPWSYYPLAPFPLSVTSI
jgi:hypothetical protein